MIAANISQRSKIGIFLALLAMLAANVFLPALAAQEFEIRLDPAQTKIDFGLGSTLHTVHGTFHLKSGSIHFDPSTGKAGGTIVVDTGSGQSGDNGRDRKMNRDILESDKFPEIIFAPSLVKGELALKGTSQMEVSGQFRLHGRNHDITLPIDIQPMGRKLQISTHFSIPYIQWGLKNPGTFLLRADNAVEINIQSVGDMVGGEVLQ